MSLFCWMMTNISGLRTIHYTGCPSGTVIDANPDVAEIINKISAAIITETMTKLECTGGYR